MTGIHSRSVVIVDVSPKDCLLFDVAKLTSREEW